MEVRTDLLKYLTAEDVLEEALATVHRYDPEPTFSKRGVGSLHPTSPEDKEKDSHRSEALVNKLLERQKNEA